jgi:RNA polymerase sigma factor (sigma-70 family)
MTYTTETFRKAVNGDEKSIQETIVQFTPLVHRLVNKNSYMVNGHTKEDLVQEGVIGVINGIRTFDLDRPVVPMTWLFWKVREAIQKAAKKEGKHPKYTVPIDEIDLSYEEDDLNNKESLNLPQIKDILLNRYGSSDSPGYKVICLKYGLLGHRELKQSEIVKEINDAGDVTISKQSVSQCIIRFSNSIRKRHPELAELIQS